MPSIERELNLYLFYECGCDGHESDVSASWPFRLRKVGEVGKDPLFEFQADEPYFALVTGGLNFLPRAGMDVSALLLQIKGSQWISVREPVSLEVSMLGDESVPTTAERRQALHLLGTDVVSGGIVETLEGLFLRSERRYLGLFRNAGESVAVVGGLPRKISVPFPEASEWRRLAWGVGHWLEEESGAAGAG